MPRAVSARCTPLLARARRPLLPLVPLLLALAAPAAAAPPGAIPAFCETGIGVGGEAVLTCRRADTRAQFTNVPGGLFLHVTDIHVTRNNIATTGSFAVLIGRDDTSDFPTYPSLDITGGPIGVNAISFTTPYIVLAQGESLAIANFESSDFPIDVYVSGYLASSVAP